MNEKYQINNKIKAIIFDVGGVLLEKDWDKIKEDMQRKHGFSTKIYSDYPKSMHKHYRGLSTGKKTFKNVIRLLSGKKNIQKILKDYELSHKRNTKKNTPLFNILKKLRENYKLYCLTDINDLHHWFHKRNKVYSNFLKTYASCNTGLKKPDKKCFKLILKNQGLKPEETIFIDDKRENVLSARSLGIKSIVFKNNDQLIKNLNKLGIKIQK